MIVDRREYFRARADNVRAQLNPYQLLSYYGVPGVSPGDVGHELQYPCPLHGDGQDNSFSARIYPEGGTFCFACNKARDVIQWTRDKENLSFMQAIRLLESRFSLRPLPGFYEFREELEASGPTLEEEVAAMLKGMGQPDVREMDWESFHYGMAQFLHRHKDSLPLSLVIQSWRAFDIVRHATETGEITVSDAEARLLKLKTRIQHYSR